MRTIKIDANNISLQTIKTVAEQFKHLTEAQKTTVLAEMGLMIYFEEARGQIEENETVWLELMTELNGVKDSGGAEIKFKVKKCEGELRIDIDSLAKTFNIDKDSEDIKNLMSLANSKTHLLRNEPFTHPLAEVVESDDPENPQLINVYTIPMFMINVIRRVPLYLEGFLGKPDTLDDEIMYTETKFKNLLLQASPTTNIDYLVSKIKLHDLNAMYEATTKIAKHIEKETENMFNE